MEMEQTEHWRASEREACSLVVRKLWNVEVEGGSGRDELGHVVEDPVPPALGGALVW